MQNPIHTVAKARGRDRGVFSFPNCFVSIFAESTLIYATTMLVSVCFLAYTAPQLFVLYSTLGSDELTFANGCKV